MFSKEIYKTANAQTSFIITANFGLIREKGDKEIESDKLLYTMVQRDANNKAIKTLKFWQDLPQALYLMRLIDSGALFKSSKDQYEYKKTEKVNRAFKVSMKDKGEEKGKAVRFVIEEISKDKKEDKSFLYFDLTPKDARMMSHYVYLVIQFYMNAYMLRQLLKPNKKKQKDEEN